MWHFAIGLYLVELTPGSLRLTAIYQLVSTLSIIIFGPLVGDWVDANPRLKGTTSILNPWGVLPEKLGGGVWPASQNPYPIYDQSLRYSLPYL